MFVFFLKTSQKDVGCFENALFSCTVINFRDIIDNLIYVFQILHTPVVVAMLNFFLCDEDMVL